MAVIYTRMSEFLGISSTEANVRKIALNGYIFHVDLALVEELVSLQYLCSHNFNQWRFMLIPSEVVSRKFRKMVYRSCKEQLEVAEWCLVSPRQVRNWIRKDTNISVMNLYSLADCPECKTDDLVISLPMPEGKE